MDQIKYPSKASMVGKGTRIAWMTRMVRAGPRLTPPPLPLCNHHLSFPPQPLSLIPFFFRGNHYQALGVDPKASAKDIKAKFYRQSLDCHPDRHPGNEEALGRFLRLNEAYAILSNSQRRRDYDSTLRQNTSPSDSTDYPSAASPFRPNAYPRAGQTYQDEWVQYRRAQHAKSNLRQTGAGWRGSLNYRDAEGRPIYDFHLHQDKHYNAERRAQSRMSADRMGDMEDGAHELERINVRYRVALIFIMVSVYFFLFSDSFSYFLRNL